MAGDDCICISSPEIFLYQDEFIFKQSDRPGEIACEQVGVPRAKQNVLLSIAIFSY